MKLATIILICALSISAVPVKPHTLDFSAEQVRLEEVLKMLKNHTGTYFFYDASLLLDTKPLTVDWENVTVDAALTEMFKDQPISWIVEDKTVTIFRTPDITPPVKVLKTRPAYRWQPSSFK